MRYVIESGYSTALTAEQDGPSGSVFAPSQMFAACYVSLNPNISWRWRSPGFRMVASSRGLEGSTGERVSEIESCRYVCLSDADSPELFSQNFNSEITGVGQPLSHWLGGLSLE